jgi:hypothetical protein
MANQVLLGYDYGFNHYFNLHDSEPGSTRIYLVG